MHKRHTQTPIQASYNLDNEVNVKEYPYYRNIPIESIAERQQQMLQQYNSVAVCNTSVTPFAPFAPITSVESLYEEQKEQKEQKVFQSLRRHHTRVP